MSETKFTINNIENNLEPCENEYHDLFCKIPTYFGVTHKSKKGYYRRRYILCSQCASPKVNNNEDSCIYSIKLPQNKILNIDSQDIYDTYVIPRIKIESELKKSSQSAKDIENEKIKYGHIIDNNN